MKLPKLKANKEKKDSQWQIYIVGLLKVRFVTKTDSRGISLAHR